MSERYGPCPYCKGQGKFTITRIMTGKIFSRECGLCQGTGFDGSVKAYEEKNARSDWEQESWRHVGEPRKSTGEP